MARHKIDVILNDKEEEFIKNAIKERLYGSATTKQTMLQSMFYLQMREDMDLYEREYVNER